MHPRSVEEKGYSQKCIRMYRKTWKCASNVYLPALARRCPLIFKANVYASGCSVNVPLFKNACALYECYRFRCVLSLLTVNDELLTICMRSFWSIKLVHNENLVQRQYQPPPSPTPLHDCLLNIDYANPFKWIQRLNQLYRNQVSPWLESLTQCWAAGFHVYLTKPRLFNE